VIFKWVIIPSIVTCFIYKYIDTSLLVSASIGHHQKVLQHYREILYIYAIHVSVYGFLPLQIKISYTISYLPILTNQPTNQQSPSWEANSFRDSQKFPTFYDTRSFTAVLRARQQTLTRGIPYNPISIRSILILPSHLCLDLPSGSLNTSILKGIIKGLYIII
jgi:hypothetical protein